MAFDPEYVAAIEKEQQRLIYEEIARLKAPVFAQSKKTKRFATDAEMVAAALEVITSKERPLDMIERSERLLESLRAKLGEIEAA